MVQHSQKNNIFNFNNRNDAIIVRSANTTYTSKLEEAIASNSNYSPVMLSIFDLKRKV